jgi:ribosomal 50S subunit-associated protein YjgA (DUF615 family)
MKGFVVILILFFYLALVSQTNSRREMADLVVLSRNIFKIQPDEIQKTEVKMTIFNGKVIYKK